MADSYRDIAQQLRDFNPSLSLVTSGTQYDRLYSEQRTLTRSGSYILYPTTARYVLRPECVPGVAHPKCNYLILVEAYKTGGDDNNENWQFNYRLDLHAFAAAVPAIGSFPNMLVEDNKQKVDEYGDDGSVITWSFDVINWSGYTKPDTNTDHPTITDAKLVSETYVRNGVSARVTRRYEKLPVLSDFDYDEETGDLIETTRQIVHSVTAPSPVVGSNVSQKALGTAFSLLVIRSIGGTPTAYDYRDYIDFEFPNLITGIATYIYGSAFRFEPLLRSGYGKKVVARFEVDFHTEQPALSALHQQFAVNIHYNGFTFSLRENNVLTDSWNIFNSPTEEYTTPASSPTYTEYLALIGTEVLISEKSAPWGAWYGLWRRIKIYITLE